MQYGERFPLPQRVPWHSEDVPISSVATPVQIAAGAPRLPGAACSCRTFEGQGRGLAASAALTYRSFPRQPPRR